MKRYLLIKHWGKGTYTTDVITKKELLECKDNMCEEIIDLEKGTYFGPKENQWVEIKEE